MTTDLNDAQRQLLDALADAFGPWLKQAPHETASSSEDRVAQRLACIEQQRQQRIDTVMNLALAELATLDKPLAQTPVLHWLGRWFEHVQNEAEPERLPIWARLLVLEAREAHSVDSRTLQTFACMDDWELEGLAVCCAFAFQFESGWRFMWVDELAEKEIINYQQGNDFTQHCIELGLIAAETAVMRCRSARGMRIQYVERVYELAKPENDQAILSYRRFTRSGQQLANALRPKKFYGFARNLLQSLAQLRGAVWTLQEPTTSSTPST